MKANEYQEKALRTASTSKPDDLVLNGVLGLAGESGEVADHVKKALFQGHKMDYDHIADELGDILWYVAIMSKGIGCTLDEIMTMNVEKLKKRYPDGFDSDKSLNRDK
jgi:NTP pyrophosphatase (non-canonical NTP hydrolase)